MKLSQWTLQTCILGASILLGWIVSSEEKNGKSEEPHLLSQSSNPTLIESASTISESRPQADVDNDHFLRLSDVDFQYVAENLSGVKFSGSPQFDEFILKSLGLTEVQSKGVNQKLAGLHKSIQNLEVSTMQIIERSDSRVILQIPAYEESVEAIFESFENEIESLVGPNNQIILTSLAENGFDSYFSGLGSHSKMFIIDTLDDGYLSVEARTVGPEIPGDEYITTQMPRKWQHLAVFQEE
ncbi:MAG: hypothetical protein AAGA58_04505 [Verrucomicrobiota bacterium]